MKQILHSDWYPSKHNVLAIYLFIGPTLYCLVATNSAIYTCGVALYIIQLFHDVVFDLVVVAAL